MSTQHMYGSADYQFGTVIIDNNSNNSDYISRGNESQSVKMPSPVKQWHKFNQAPRKLFEQCINIQNKYKHVQVS